MKITLNLNITPDVNLGSDSLIICNQDSVILDAGGGYSYYNWNNGSQSQSININTSGFYSVNVGNFNCQSSDSIYVGFDTIINSYLYVTSLGDYTLNGITYTQSGNYTQTLNSVYGCDSIINLSLFIEVGMDEPLQNAIEVFPNPSVGGIFYLQYPEELVRTKSLVVYDLFGKKVKELEQET